ncbi:MAG: FtsX-like permease family protein [bacterium]
MLISDIFRLATRMFRTNRSRTVLTILGISVGIGAILFLVSFGYGLQKLILEKITNSESLLSMDVSTGNLEGLKIDDKTIEKIKNVDNVEKVSPLISTQVLMNINDISTELQGNFANSDFLSLEGLTTSNGRFYTDALEDENSILISSSALLLFNLSEEEAFKKDIYFTFFEQEKTDDGIKLTRKFKKNDQPFRIVGIIKEESSNYIYFTSANSKYLDVSYYSKVKAKVDKQENLDKVRNEIVDMGLVVSALSDLIEQANQIFSIIQIILASFGIVALIVSAIGMFNTMTITLLERTQEIGIMKALGATGADVWKMFLAESLIIGFFGGMGGIILGVAGGEIFNYGLNILAGVMGGEKIDMFYSPTWFIILIISFSTFVGFITGFYPAKRAASINPLEALRYK